jgi:3-hydroxymyristoyl/3-hydroxydecanoyl-(acyl carrier protein) dehydratase
MPGVTIIEAMAQTSRDGWHHDGADGHEHADLFHGH